ncbi:MAG: PadR family transcriptional regulator [Candidatus Nanopelagicales bacterium]
MTGFAAPGAWPFGPGAFTDENLREMRDRMRAHMGAHHGGRRGPGGPGGPGRGFGGPFGPWRGWGFGPGEGRRAGRGDVRTAVLALLTEGPRHGYQMIGEIAERSGGAWKPSPGSIYPVLSALQDEGLVDDEKIDGKRVFSLTDTGRAYAEERADELAHVFDANSAGEDEGVTDLRQLLMGVGSAAVQVVTTGTPEQVAAARTVLTNARRELYLILAEDAS